MFSDPTRGRSQGFTLATVALGGVLVLGACSDPEQNTDLRPDGPPDVLAVLVMNDAAGHLVERATYCKMGDEKRPQLVGLPDFVARDICPADLSKGADEIVDAYPDGWYVRIMFDELLDPNIEELEEILDEDGVGTDTFKGSIKNTQPVKLECESIGGGFVEVEYDGYYSPSGNAVTWPLGPSLVIIPDDATEIATGKQCRVTINDNVTDKSGNKVPDADRAPGKFTFRLAPIQLIAIDPPDDPDSESPVGADQIWNDNFYFQFNTTIDPASFCDEGTSGDECEFEILPEDTGLCSVSGDFCLKSRNGSDCPAAETCVSGGYYAYTYDPSDNTEFGAGPNAAIQTDHEYTFQFRQGTKLKDRCGVETTFGAPSSADLTLVNFKTSKFAMKSLNIGQGDLASPMKKLTLPFTNVVDESSLALGTEITVTPALANAALLTSNGVNLVLAGDYALDTTYTIVLKAGSKISDVLGAETTIEADKTITYKTQPAVTLSTTADGGTVTRSTTAPTEIITLTFNQSMSVASFVQDTDFTLVNANNVRVPATVSVGDPNSLGFPAGGADCTPGATSCQFLVSVAAANLTPGVYTFTLKQNANITGVVGSSFTQTADKVIKFTVKDPTPATPHVCL